MSWMLVCVGALAFAPRVAVTPPGTVAEHTARFAAHRVPVDLRRLRDGAWVRELFAVHADTTWHVRRIGAPHGGAVIVLREHWRGRPIAGARLAVRVDAGGGVRQVIGTAVDPGLRLDSGSGFPRGAQRGSGLVWWPTPSGLVPARIELGPLTWSQRTPRRDRRIVGLVDGRELAREPALDHAAVPLVGWAENPVTTPTLETFVVELDDDVPLRLSSPALRVFHCPLPASECESLDFPTADGPDGFPDDPPPVDDVMGHADPEDPYAGIQAFQYGARFMDALHRWGWNDPEPLEIHTNVMSRNDDGDLEPFDGAFYSGEVYMGQGERVDSSYDLQVLVHEIGHHVTATWGAPEPTDEHDDPGYLATDARALNEAASDFYASLMGPSAELFVYFRNLGGLYQGPRIRDISIPFRCPQNVTGEFHMEGRIWASAMREIHDEVVMRWGDADTFPAVFNAANAAIRQIPREQRAQFADASEILIDEVRLALGDDAAAFTVDLLAERGLSSCDHVIDIDDEPSVTGQGDPADPLHARFLLLESHDDDVTPEDVEQHPFAPAVSHRVTLGANEGGAILRFIPDRWRSTKRADEPLDQDGLVVAALVRAGGGGLGFTRDPDTGLWSHEGELASTSAPDPEYGPPWHAVEITDLTPGETYSIAIVSMTTFADGDRRNLLVDDMRWELRPAPDDGDGSGTDTGTAPDGDTDEDSGSTAGTDDGAGDDTDEDDTGAGAVAVAGCGCTTRPTRGAGWWALPVIATLRRRRRSRRRGRRA